MKNAKITIEPIAECSLMLRYQAEVSAENSVVIGALATRIRSEFGHLIMNVTPSYNSILIDYLPYRVTEPHFINELNKLSQCFMNVFSSNLMQCNVITLPVYYGEETALDLFRFVDRGVSLSNLIETHTRQEYSVSAIGFAPGFAFLSDVDHSISMPRLTTPRLSVPKGSVGIADSKTAIYPSQSPAGWNIIGNCPIPLFDISNATQESVDSISLFSIGDKVKFEAIDRATFIELGGELNG